MCLKTKICRISIRNLGSEVEICMCFWTWSCQLFRQNSPLCNMHYCPFWISGVYLKRLQEPNVKDLFLILFPLSACLPLAVTVPDHSAAVSLPVMKTAPSLGNVYRFVLEIVQVLDSLESFWGTSGTTTVYIYRWSISTEDIITLLSYLYWLGTWAQRRYKPTVIASISPAL